MSDESGGKWSKVGSTSSGPDEGGDGRCSWARTLPSSTTRAGSSSRRSSATTSAAASSITRGQERCLYVFSTREFERIHERIRQAPLTNKQARDFLRLFLSGASAEKPDSQNRITIPPPLRSYAGLERELIVIGVGAHAEIWDADAWNAYAEGKEESYAELEQEVIPGLF